LGAESAKVGYGVDPETKHIQKYMLNRYIRLWDTPGLGDNPADDAAYTRAISDLLRKRTTAADGSRGHIIDMALVLVDAGSRDIGTVYSILNTLIFSRINENRVLLAVNQADMAMKRRHWEGAAPDDTLRRFLDEQAESLQKRVFEATGKRIKKPVYYSAANNFNLYSLIDYIIDSFDEFQWELRT
jgi:predicted GTPase